MLGEKQYQSKTTLYKADIQVSEKQESKDEIKRRSDSIVIE